jgi:hypothetical protein
LEISKMGEDIQRFIKRNIALASIVTVEDVTSL